MNGRRFYIVDVFAEEKYAGNQLAVICDCEDLDAESMQQIALEMNYSETTFLLDNRPGDDGFPVRIFTPAAEVPFAGHPTLGTAAIIRRKVLSDRPDRIVLDLKAGSIPVEEEDGLLWMEQNQPEFGGIYDNGHIAQILGIDNRNIERNFPIQAVSTGLPFIICPLTSLNVLQSIQVDRRRLLELAAVSEAKAILAFAPQGRSPEEDLSVRVFTDFYGIPEDPATGSANGNLAAYLVRHRYFGTHSIDLEVGQGHEIRRPSRLYLRAQESERRFSIRVGGRVIEVAEGLLT